MVDPRNFLLNTEYPIEKIVYLKHGSFVSRANNLTFSHRFNHGLPYRPLLKGSWSFNANFNTAYDFFNDPYAPNDRIVCDLISTNQEVIFADRNLAQDITIYYRLLGFAPDNSLLSYPETATTSPNKFIHNTDFNYCKLALSGSVDTRNGRAVIPHNLGFLPQIDIWTEGAVGLYNRSLGDGLVSVDEQNLYFEADNKIHYYRIYADEP